MSQPDVRAARVGVREYPALDSIMFGLWIYSSLN